MPRPDPKTLARSPRDLTTAWATRVLQAHAPEARASAVELEDVDVGTTTRVRLTVAHDGPEDLPRRWFVKLPSASWRARAITALPRLPQTEVRFYAEVSAQVPVPRPRALLSATRWGRGYCLVLADVTEVGAVPGKPQDALSAERAGAVVDQLARLHASHWESPALDGELAWLAGPVRKLEDRLGTALAVPLMRRGLRRAGGAVPEAVHAPALAYARRRRQAMQALAAGPRTLIHHDCHPGNLYWQGEEPGLLDWQLVRIGEGVGDVAYLLGVALEPETRREAEGDLLERYRQGLREHGAPEPALSQLEERYSAHLTYAFEAMVVTLAIGGLMPDEVALELSRRAAAAVIDRGAFAAVGC